MKLNQEIIDYFSKFKSEEYSNLIELLETHILIYSKLKKYEFSIIYFRFECSVCNATLDEIVGKGDIVESSFTCDEMVVKKVLE